MYFHISPLNIKAVTCISLHVMLGIVWVNKKKILHRFGEDDIMRQNASCSNTLLSISFYKGNFDNKAKEQDMQKYMVSAAKHDKNFC